MSRRPSLLMISGGLPVGGSTTFLLNLAKAYRAADTNVPILTLSRSPDAVKEFARFGLQVIECCDPSKIYEDRLFEAFQFVRSLNPRTVVSCLGSESFEILRIVPEGVTRIGVIQSDDPVVYDMVAQFCEWIDVLVGVSRAICKKIAADSRFTRCQVEYIPYGIAFPPVMPRAQRQQTNVLRVIYLGRLIEEQKRISRVVALAKEIDLRRLPIEVTIAGSGPDAEAVRSEVECLKCVRWHGPVQNDSAFDLFADHDVFVLLSDYEGLPLTLLESMGMGAVPVVSDLESGIPEVVTPSTGFRIPCSDLSRVTAALMSLHASPKLLNELSRNCSELIRDSYSAQRMMKRYEELSPCRTPPVWPAIPRIPAPLGIDHPILSSYLGRHLRRVLRAITWRALRARSTRL